MTVEDRQFWAFTKPSRPSVPNVRHAARVRTPIDAFLLAKLEAKGLSFTVDADPTALVRRAYLDLLGLPPSPEEVQAFLADARPDAFEQLVDRLLASPHYGERFGRHWLDVAGYVDTIGFDTDATNILLSDGKWLYRDYVIRAFNDDKPYDRFITEQLAGDELYDWRRSARFTPEIREALIATGYLRTAADETLQNELNTADILQARAEHTMEVVASNLLGLTLNCARCHNHKFDPIPQEDYYRLMATLTPAYNPQAWRPVVPTETKTIPDRGLPDVSPAEQAEIERHNGELDRQLAELRTALAELRRPHVARLFEAHLAALPEAIRADTKAALDTPAERRSEVQKYLAGKFAHLAVKPEEELPLGDDGPTRRPPELLTAQIAADPRAAASGARFKPSTTSARCRKHISCCAAMNKRPEPKFRPASCECCAARRPARWRRSLPAKTSAAGGRRWPAG